MLAKPEYFSTPDEVCCWPGVPSGKNLLAKAHKNPDFVLGKEGDWHQGERKLASGSATVAFLQITAHALKM